jgi:hypothetical protein
MGEENIFDEAKGHIQQAVLSIGQVFGAMIRVKQSATRPDATPARASV